MSILLQGWLTKDGGAMGSAKSRYCVLTLASHGKTFMLDYYADKEKIDKKGTFLLARDCRFTKVANNSFTIEVASSDSSKRKSGSVVEFGAGTQEIFALWERALVLAENPTKVVVVKKRNLIVLGASSSIGLATIKQLSKLTGDITVYATVADLTSPETEPLRLPGIVLKAADLTKPESMSSLLVGFDVVFIIAPEDKNRAVVVIDTINVCKSSKVGHIVVLSGITATLPSTIFGAEFHLVETAVRESDIPFTIVRVPLFMENILSQLQLIGGKGDFFSPLPSTTVYNAASISDIGETVSKIVADSKQYVGMTLSLTGAVYSEKDYAEAFSKVLGSPVKHVKVPYEVTKRALGGSWSTDGILELYKLIEKGEPGLVSDISDMSVILGRELTSPLSIATSVEADLKIIHERYVRAEAERKEAERLVKQNARLLYFKVTPSSISEGSWQQKKTGSEVFFQKRWLWIDYDAGTFNWSKTEGKAEGKSIVLSVAGTTVEAVSDVLQIKQELQPTIDIKAYDLVAWEKALKTIIAK